jgi:SAM-dependent methyltransferase
VRRIEAGPASTSGPTLELQQGYPSGAASLWCGAVEEYIFAGGEEGKARLGLQSAAYRPSTLDLFSTLGVRPGWRCLDVGCGGGQVTTDLARIVAPSGLAVGVDFDDVIIDLARKAAAQQGVGSVEFRVGRAEELDESGFDLAYTRLLLDVVSDPRTVLSKMAAAVVPNGVVIAEEAEASSSFCYPPNDAFRRWVEWFCETLRRRGGDPDIGPRLPLLFRAAGLHDIGLRIVHLAWIEGQEKWLHWMAMGDVRDAVVGEGVATPSEFDDVQDEIRALAEDPSTARPVPARSGRPARSCDVPLQEAAHDLRIDDGAAVADPADRVGQLAEIRHPVLEEVTDASGPVRQQRHRVGGLHVLGQHQDPDVGVFHSKAVSGDKTLVGIGRRHPDVDDRHPGPEAPDTSEQVLRVGGQ